MARIGRAPAREDQAKAEVIRWYSPREISQYSNINSDTKERT